MKVLIYGTGSKSIRYLPAIGLVHEIVAFVETVKTKDSFFSKPVLTVDKIKEVEFDCVIICSSFSEEIEESLKKAGIIYFKDIQADINLVEIQKKFAEMEIQYRQLEQKRSIESMKYYPLKEKHIVHAKLLASREDLLKELPPESVGAEIGVDKGEFSQMILSVVRPEKLHLIDIWGTERYNSELWRLVNEGFADQITSGQVEIHRKLSIEAADDFPDNYFNWVYIDTDHSYETTYKELQLYSKKVKAGGLIMGHDYCMGNWIKNYKYGVTEAVYRFCVEQDYEIVFLSMEITQSFGLRKIIE
ncbi:class I SAM-dependent methyltransferase [Alteromonas pelagimontana]|uniref:Class I SAM-dependent methyltransferase n=1 Tax=Alteromonas pelagimontana TaxID=1858656 RepID=A0A6M4MF88_9ALTE|nr:class I SAM-dependent methyltransferase [Alteromonas pelagimontana]QJR81841.1 class I SAM-dependent methyltransferase [Alteromonas pelagimontana]